MAKKKEQEEDDKKKNKKSDKKKSKKSKKIGQEEVSCVGPGRPGPTTQWARSQRRSSEAGRRAAT